MSWHMAFRLSLGTLKLEVDVAGGQRPVALIGPNGAGKTTVIRTLCGAHVPDFGHIRLGEEVLFDAEKSLYLPPEQRRVGYVPQGYRLFPHLSVLDNVAFGSVCAGESPTRAARRRAARTLLEQLDCAALTERAVGELSGGEQQKVALARAVAARPRMLLLDEPLAALDVVTRRELRGWMAAYLESQALPSIMATHDPRDVLALDAWVVALENGVVIQQGEAAALSASPNSVFVEAFFGDLDVRAKGEVPDPL